VEKLPFEAEEPTPAAAEQIGAPGGGRRARGSAFLRPSDSGENPRSTRDFSPVLCAITPAAAFDAADVTPSGAEATWRIGFLPG
jgi:hypothetical protein